MTDLLKAMDAAAIVLLKRAALSDTTDKKAGETAEDDDDAEAPTINEGVKAFDSVFAYAKWREDGKRPPDRAPFSALKDRFHGNDPPVRRAGKRANGAHPDPAADDPA
jgi:hypothetical protein